ncbi:helix-turn-helix domain-containing protein [Aliivibrio sifiae]|uniref:helix-turn-helix domain-containing protein n=1 Tax=Aliivibrio sifiae TaxID=566293 RepID=UPI0021570495|nr:helix-turn-helix domain-containing protein [Aliivibrio sifiae]
MAATILHINRIKPNQQLSPFIAHYWLWKSTHHPYVPDILPGTGAELLINTGGPLVISQPFHHLLLTGQSVLICPRRTTFKFKKIGESQLISIRFRSSGCYSIFGIPMDELSDQIIDMYQFLPEELIERIIIKSNYAEKIHLLESWLMGRVNPRILTSSAITWAIDRTYYQNNYRGINELQLEVNMSKRTFQRKFKLYTGVDAKYFERTARFQSTLRMQLNNADNNYVDIALDNGYYDQSHFIKEFRYFTGTSPKKYLTKENFMLNHYNK